MIERKACQSTVARRVVIACAAGALLSACASGSASLAQTGTASSPATETVASSSAGQSHEDSAAPVATIDETVRASPLFERAVESLGLSGLPDDQLARHASSIENSMRFMAFGEGEAVRTTFAELPEDWPSGVPDPPVVDGLEGERFTTSLGEVRLFVKGEIDVDDPKQLVQAYGATLEAAGFTADEVTIYDSPPLHYNVVYLRGEEEARLDGALLDFGGDDLRVRFLVVYGPKL